ncbi:malto-oligosyltrehalose synthase [Tranquillimonas rosea]|uniref:malto-oligosyltrehalose synthase n=1 Tax=Tranquillimonas rosea TaxID=641238 RepID=UPI003BAC96AA
MSFVASYRVQLRDGLDFAGLAGRLDQIAALGVSHLYLPPILQAAPGSTHGYDVVDPTRIDPALGGREGFEALSRAAQERGLKLILDIVPNHMAFGPETPWLRDVLAHGQDSDRAAVFDIDWSAGPLALPWLTQPLGDAAEQGEVSVEGDTLWVGDLSVPLAPGSGAGLTGVPDRDAAELLHAGQHWRLMPWQLERDSITHRRFFSVTGLIGVRVEDEAVFELTHQCIFELAEAGLIHGLRVDHVDGLVDPGAYLRRLADRLPDIPVWVEKILVTNETLRDWPVAGTTGYEAAAVIGRALTRRDGGARIDRIWRNATGIEDGFHAFVEEAKREVLTDELAAELRQLCGLAERMAEAEGFLAGPEMLREALTELLVAFPRYRSYITDAADAEDAAIWRDSAARAGEHVRSSEVIDRIVAAVIAPQTPEARRLALRLQQVTGALIAKAHEDTAGFRFNRYLAANEVGADPDRPVCDDAEIRRFLQDRLDHWPHALTLGSSHDTKRSEDARARLIAMTHAPDALAELWHDAAALDGSDALDANRRFYALQAALALWGEPQAADRVGDHLIKALREGKEITYWTAPDEDRERRMVDWAQRLLSRWDVARPAPLLRLCRIGAALSLRELALRCVVPGMPDIYQGGEGALFQLTDPDNRRAPDWDALARLPAGADLASRKADLLRTLLDLRRRSPDLFERGTVEWRVEDGARHLVRRLGPKTVTVVMADGAAADGALWSDTDPETGLALGIYSGG